jgi:glutamate formiminotransferase/formiminotetrahydrofolate cyclodeaminase
MITTTPLNQFLDELASRSPAPGGGSVAALSGALGAALTTMVCHLTIGKKKYADVQREMESVLKRSEELRASFSKLVEKDVEAFNSVMNAFSLPRETEEQMRVRTGAVEEATKKATLVPLKVMELCMEALPLTKAIAEKGNRNSISDAGVSALMLGAACEGAALNVRINLGTLQDKPFVKETRAKMKKVLDEVESLTKEVLRIIDAKLSGGPSI